MYASMYQDKQLMCQECNTPFLFAALEQQRYHAKGLFYDPTRCETCRRAKKTTYRTNEGQRNRRTFSITCVSCGRTDTIPFAPRKQYPVLCGECRWNTP